MMGSPAMDIQGSVSAFAGGATFYPGDELIFTMANGTTIPANWVAVYNELYFTGPLATGGDFYNYFVLGLLPASYDSTPLPDFFNSSSNWEADFYLEDDDSFITNWTDMTPAYPADPVVAQEGLYVASDQVVTGYLLPEISTGVLSLPTFNQFDTAKETFAAAIDEFIQNATTQGMQRVVIDLQQNWGGDVMLAFATFKMFFPQADPPFAGSHKRSHLMADVLGKTFTEYWDRLSLDNDDEVDDKLGWMGREWVVTPRINAETGDNFTSWEEYAGPVGYGGDSFSTPVSGPCFSADTHFHHFLDCTNGLETQERYNLSNVNFDMAEFDGWIPVDYVEAPTQEQPYDASNIVILTDGICASTCSLFVEMMTQAGVRTVVVGGRPESGPMQAASGTRAAAMYTAAALDDDFNNATNILTVHGDYRPSNDSLALLSGPRNTGMWINSAGFSIRDQVRSVDDPEPLQLKYQPADCRIYWTLDNVVNFTRLWSDAAAATWDDPGRCVAGSSSSKSTTTTTTTSPPPPPRLRNGLSDQALGNMQITSLYQSTIRCNLDDKREYGYDSCGTDLGLSCRAADPKNKLSGAGYCVSTCSSTDQTCLVADQQCKLSKTPLKLESKGLRASGATTAAGAKGRTTSIYPGHCRPVTTKTKNQKLGDSSPLL
ncbi:Peptidase S41 family protein ustP [Apiospora saccharicola]